MACPQRWRNGGPGFLRAEIERAAYYARASRSPETQRAYASDWRIFVAWCDQRGRRSCR